MISEESCDMENWSNNAENSALQKEIYFIKMRSHKSITYQFTVLKNKQERDGLHTLTKTLQYIRMLKNPVNTQLMKNIHLAIYNSFKDNIKN